MSDVSAELTPKRMDLLRAQASEAGAKSMSIGVQKLALGGPGDFDKVFGALSDEKPGGLRAADTLQAGGEPQDGLTVPPVILAGADQVIE